MFSIFLFFEVEKYSTFWGFLVVLAGIDKSIFGWAFVCSGRSLRLGRHLGMVLRMISQVFRITSAQVLFSDGHLELPRILKRFAKHCSLVFIFVGEWPGMFAGIWLIRLVEIHGSIKGLGVLIENASYRIAVG